MREVERILLTERMHAVHDPMGAFLIAASAPRAGDHGAGTLDEAEAIRARYPLVGRANVYTAAVLGDEIAVRELVAKDPVAARAKGGVYEWNALTYLCFSRYLRIEMNRSEAFIRAARTLLDAGASAQTGWYESIYEPNPREILESAIYGAAGVARNVELTRLLLELGADPNDEETPYHVPESYDNAVMEVLLQSGKLNERSKSWLLVRKADWHDEAGMRMVLEYGCDPNLMTRWGRNPLQHAIQRDNGLGILTILLDHGANPLLRNNHDGRTAAAMAAHRGRGDFLLELERRGMDGGLEGTEQMIAACARGEMERAKALKDKDPEAIFLLHPHGGHLLAEFAGNGNVEGIKCLLDLGVPVDARYAGDGYFDEASDSTALHVAAWRGRPKVTRLLLELGADVNAKDGRGRTALQLAVRACMNSHWTRRRSVEWVKPLIEAGANLEGVEIPCGYYEVDAALKEYRARR